MNVISGEITEIFVEDGRPMAMMNVRGALKQVSLMFVTEAHVGDTILAESGVAISNVRREMVEGN
jgi:hydrogenase maturation factor